MLPPCVAAARCAGSRVSTVITANILGIAGYFYEKFCRYSVPNRPIDDVLERPAGLEALDLAEHIGNQRAGVGCRGIVRRDGHPRMGPERARRRQRLGRKGVERRP